MKCSKTDQLRAYLHGELSDVESRHLEHHVADCLICQQLMLENEEPYLIDLAVPSNLPAGFTSQVMSALEHLPQPVPKPNWKKRSMAIMKKTALAVAGVTALVTFGSIVSPTFASYVNSVIQSIQGVDNGLKKAVENGYVQDINKRVADQGITLVVKEVLADPMRIAIICDIVDQNGKNIPYKMQDDEFRLTYKNKAGEDLNPAGGGWTTRKEGDYVVLKQDFFTLFKDPKDIPDEMKVSVEATKLGGKEGKWLIEFPVDMKKAKAAAKYTHLNQQFTTPQGIAIKLNNIMTVPSASLLEMETDWTEERIKQVKKTMAENGWVAGKPEPGKYTEADMMERYFQDIGMSYQVLDEKGNVVAGWDDAIYEEINKIRTNTVEHTTRGIGTAENSNQFKVWNGFAPFADHAKLKFKLHSLYLFEPVKFKAQVSVDQLLKQEVTVENSGNQYTFTGFSMKTTDEEEKLGEHTYRGKGAILPFSGKLPEGIIYTTEWKAKDEKGNEYPVSRNETYARGEDGRVRVSGTLFIRGLEHQPKELTFVHSVQQREYRNLNWEVPFEMNK
ncbi:DUF4179 domain-containing protein [Brevibacillus sp. NRS-1366]|uniref:DUF4179 domain-containing protein n=1 Tax=Brevibacillus sp. NRS-1366 TaxID=3233899 RepID=UPI003D228C13